MSTHQRARLAVGRIISGLVMAGGWVLVGARTVLDLVGYSTAPEDIETAQTRLDQVFSFILSLPWWSVWGFALITTIWLMWVSWPRSVRANIVPGEKVILPSPDHLANLTTTTQDAVHLCTAKPAPPHSIATIRYRVGYGIGASVWGGDQPIRLSIREVGSKDEPILQGVGQADVKLNRHSQFEYHTLMSLKGTAHIDFWLVGWLTD